MYRRPANLKFSFIPPCWDIIKHLNGFIWKTAVFELVQQFYHVT